jgi:hypothetical protein
MTTPTQCGSIRRNARGIKPANGEQGGRDGKDSKDSKDGLWFEVSYLAN